MPAKRKLSAKLKDKRFNGIIESVLRYGLTSHRIALNISDGDVEAKELIYAFNNLIRAERMLEPLTCGKMYAGPGRSEKPFALTHTGVQVLEDLGYQGAEYLKLDGPLDVAHRFSSALVASYTSGAVIEKVIPYAKGHWVRADVFFHSVNVNRTIEIEQGLDNKNKDRAIKKIKAYAALFATNPPKLSREMLVVFNLPKPELERTLNVWRLALRDADNPSFPIYISSLERFLAIYAPGLPTQESSNFTLLTASTKQPRVNKAPDPKPDLIPDVPVRVASMDAIREVAVEVAASIPPTFDDEDELRMFNLGEAAYAIHQLDFKQLGGRTRNYAAIPADSLDALRTFLHRPVMLPLLDMLIARIADYEKRVGITQQQLAASKLAWSFLEYFGFGRTGPLEVQIFVPDMGDQNRNEVSFRLLLSTSHKLQSLERLADYLSAISWVMSALIIYPERLDLVKETTRQSER